MAQFTLKPRENLIKKIVDETKKVLKDVERKLNEAKALGEDLQSHIKSIDEDNQKAELKKWIEIEETIKNDDKLTPGVKEAKIKKLETIMERYKDFEKKIMQIEERMKSRDAVEERYLLTETHGIIQEKNTMQEFLQLLEQYKLHPGEMKAEGLIRMIENVITLHHRIEQYQKYVLRLQEEDNNYQKQLKNYERLRNQLFNEVR